MALLNGREEINMSEFMRDLLIFAVYSFFAIRWGVRFVDGRWSFLEKPGNRLLKMIISIILGYVLAGLYFVLWCIKMIVVVLPKWLR